MYTLKTATPLWRRSVLGKPILPKLVENRQLIHSQYNQLSVEQYSDDPFEEIEREVQSQSPSVPYSQEPEQFKDSLTSSSLSVVIIVLMAYLAFLDHYRKGR